MKYLTAPDHIAAVVVTVAMSVLMVLAARRSAQWARWPARVLGTLLIANEVLYIARSVAGGSFTARYSLPLYLCDVEAFVAGIALWWPRQRLVEVAYFWGLAGSVQGLITPDSYLTFPHYDYFQYYIDHCGVIVAALVLVMGMRKYPQKGAVRRVFLTTLAFTGIVAICDVVSGGNYMYLRAEPASGSLLSIMGPWPWYICSGAVVALVFLVLLDAPFWRRRAVRYSA